MTDLERPRSDQEKFAHNLKTLRRQRGLARAALARRADVGTDTLLRIESGQRAPRLDTLLKLADALEVTPGALLDGLRPEFRKPANPMCQNQEASDAERSERLQPNC